jgi:hypothetical protein
MVDTGHGKLARRRCRYGTWSLDFINVMRRALAIGPRLLDKTLCMKKIFVSFSRMSSGYVSLVILNYSVKFRYIPGLREPLNCNLQCPDGRTLIV